MLVVIPGLDCRIVFCRFCWRSALFGLIAFFFFLVPLPPSTDRRRPGLAIFAPGPGLTPPLRPPSGGCLSWTAVIAPAVWSTSPLRTLRPRRSFCRLCLCHLLLASRCHSRSPCPAVDCCCFACADFCSPPPGGCFLLAFCESHLPLLPLLLRSLIARVWSAWRFAWVL